MRFTLGCALLTIVLTGGSLACGGGPSSEERSAERSRFSTARNAAIKAEEQAKEARQAQADAAACQEGLGEFLEALSDLNSRLSVGLSFSEYSKNLGDVRVAYDRVPFRSMPLTCSVAVGVPAENALNDYVRAHNRWNDCIGDLDCSTDSIEPDLQSKWSSAGTRISRAQNRLVGMAGAGATDSDPSAAYVATFAERFCTKKPVTRAGKDVCESLETVRKDGSVSATEAQAAKDLVAETASELDLS